jgi:Tol biopolymer transport system component
VYVAADRQNVGIVIYDLDRGREHHVARMGQQMWPIFSHDGARVVFNGNNLDHGGYLLLNTAFSDGSGEATRLPTDTINHQQPFTWAAGGKELLYTEGPGTAGNMDIWVAPLDGSGTAHPLMNSPANETQPVVSPDGRWLAWMTDASGRPEVMVRRYPDGTDVSVSREGGREPAWSRDGREIYFRDLGGTRMMVASFRPAELPEVGEPKVLFTGQFDLCYIWCRGYDVSPDGRWFVMRMPLGGFTQTGYWPAGSEIRIVPHWDREVERTLKAASR